MRCPIASMPSIPRTAFATRDSSRRPSATSNSRSTRTWSSSSTRLSLRELEPALRTRTLTFYTDASLAAGFTPAASMPESLRRGDGGRYLRSPNIREREQRRSRDERKPRGFLSLIRPCPVGDFRCVAAVVARVLPRAKATVGHLLPDARGLRPERRHAVDHVHHQMEAVEVVEHHLVEGRRRRAFFLVAAHVDVVVVRAPVSEAVNEPRIPVVGEDHRPVAREQLVELGVAHPMRML